MVIFEKKAILAVFIAIAAGLAIDGLFTGYSVHFAGTRHAERSVSKLIAEPNENINVTINIGVLSSDDFYVIDERLPDGWAVVNAGGLVTEESGHLKRVVAQGAADTAYTYTIKAPAAEGNYLFRNGTFRTEGMATPSSIGGDSAILVKQQASGEICNGLDDDHDGTVDEGCDDDNDDYCDALLVRSAQYSCSGSPNCCPLGGNDCNDSSVYVNPGASNPDKSHNSFCDCSTQAGGGLAKGKQEICGNGIDEDCSGQDMQCCKLKNAMWGANTAAKGAIVPIYVDATGCSDGETIELALYESDGPAGSSAVSGVDLGTITVKNGLAGKNWTAVWVRDSGDPPVNPEPPGYSPEDPEFFFRASWAYNHNEYLNSEILRVTTNDKDEDGTLDRDDCNDNDANIGQCTGCAECSDAKGVSGHCISSSNASCQPVECQQLCGYGSCGTVQVPVFASASEPGVCDVKGNAGACSRFCASYSCSNDTRCSIDSDGDGVPDLNDLCPGTETLYKGLVNIFGCPRPVATKFTPDLTTDFNRTNLVDIVDLSLGITSFARIRFFGKTAILSSLLSAKPVNFDSHISMQKAKVSVDSTALQMLKKPCEVTFFDLTVPHPVIKKDGAACDDCIITGAEGYSGSPDSPDNLTFTANGFSEYTAEENQCGDGFCYHDDNEGCGCPQDCGVCNLSDSEAAAAEQTFEFADECRSIPTQPCPTAVWQGYPGCYWNTSQCVEGAARCAANQSRCLGNLLQRCAEGPEQAWQTVEVCSYGCNIGSLSCNANATACEEKWSCSEWGNCSGGQRLRLCVETSGCRFYRNKPNEVEECGLGLNFSLSSRQIMVILVSIAAVLLISAIFVHKRRKRKNEVMHEKELMESLGNIPEPTRS